MRSSIPGLWDHDPTRRQTLNLQPLRRPYTYYLKTIFPTETSGQLCEAGAVITDEETDLPKATLEMWSEHTLGPLDSQPPDDSCELHSVTHFSNKYVLVSPSPCRALGIRP